MQGTINMPKSENNNFISKFVNYKIGVTPLPIFIVLVAIIYFASVTKKLPADMIGGFAIIIVLGTFFRRSWLKASSVKKHWWCCNFINNNTFYDGIF